MIHLAFPWIPPSINDLYMHIMVRKGPKSVAKRALTTEGRRFKRETVAYISKTFPAQMAQLVPNYPYDVFTRLTVTKLVNTTWPKSAESRYKQLDTDNRSKAMLDVLVEAGALDDSHFMGIYSKKVEGPSERTDIWIWNLEKEGCPFNEAALSL